MKSRRDPRRSCNELRIAASQPGTETTEPATDGKLAGLLGENEKQLTSLLSTTRLDKEIVLSTLNLD